MGASIGLLTAAAALVLAVAGMPASRPLMTADLGVGAVPSVSRGAADRASGAAPARCGVPENFNWIYARTAALGSPCGGAGERPGGSVRIG